jgi:hypothetical protein
VNKKELEKKWEKTLQKYGLGTVQQMTDNMPGEPSGVIIPESDIAQPKSDNHPDHAKLRRKIDGDDRFMSAHGIKKVRSEEREPPEWAMNDVEVARLLLKAFPKMMDPESKQRVKAGRWARVIYLYYRLNMTYSQVAKEIGVNKNTVLMILRAMMYAQSGRRRDNRPKKRSDADIIHPSSEGIGRGDGTV